MIEILQHFDVDLFLKINRSMSNPFFDWLLPLMRNRYFWAPLYLFICVFCITQYKKKGWYIIGALCLTVVMGHLLATVTLKPLVARVRPCNELSLAQDIIRRVPCPPANSFPSAHATNHFAMAVFMIFVFYDKWKPILPIAFSWAFIIAFSQVYVGVHYPVDITVGALLGTLIGFATSRLYQSLQSQQ